MAKHYYQSPVGIIEIIADEKAITGIYLKQDGRPANEGAISDPLIRKACKQLDEYFAGRRKEFTLPLSFQGTAFQVRVWKQLQQIPYGKTISYAQLAHAIQNPKACRAAGSANGKNPISIIIPCHRVIAADGSLGGYASGLEIKKQLLDLERKNT
jgi:methylated-DNA-[protein]-cysteine S-methyltransferase